MSSLYQDQAIDNKLVKALFKNEKLQLKCITPLAIITFVETIFKLLKTARLAPGLIYRQELNE